MTDVQSHASSGPGARIHIATPTHSRLICVEYLGSVFKLVSSGLRAGLQFSLSTLSFSEIATSRNYMLSDFYFNKTDCSHLLFLDDDMGFGVELIFEMLNLHVDVVGAIYPKRQIDLRKLHAAGGLPFEKALARSMDFILNSDRTTEMRNGFIRVQSCGAGILLISRQCVAKIIEANPDLVRDNREISPEIVPTLIHAFDKITEEGREFSEDISFCKRWRSCGGEIWASISHPIQHVGRFTFESRYRDG